MYASTLSDRPPATVKRHGLHPLSSVVVMLLMVLQLVQRRACTHQLVRRNRNQSTLEVKAEMLEMAGEGRR